MFATDPRTHVLAAFISVGLSAVLYAAAIIPASPSLFA
ncbi:enoyl-CoA hydratase [uncultured Erythrobacter sp.]|nr:enoyl-CoA hydratase [uncultured Erythrobacter sp.]